MQRERNENMAFFNRAAEKNFKICSIPDTCFMAVLKKKFRIFISLFLFCDLFSIIVSLGLSLSSDPCRKSHKH